MAQASVCEKLRCELDVKIYAEKIYSIFSRPYEIAKASPTIVQNVELLKGHWGEQGSILLWNYCVDGKYSTVKQEMEVVNDESKTLVFKVIEGELLDYYKSMKCIIEFTPKEDKNRSVVSCCLEYEKLNDNIPDPNSLLNAFICATNAIEANLAKN